MKTNELPQSYVNQAVDMAKDTYDAIQIYFTERDNLDEDDARIMGQVSRLCGFISALEKVDPEDDKPKD